MSTESIADQVMLVKVAAAANNNKFYEVTLQHDGLVVTRWGRVGMQGDAQWRIGNRAVFEDIVRKKLARGYQKVDDGTDTDDVGQQVMQTGWELRTTADDDRGDVLRRMRHPDPATGRRYNSLYVRARTCGVVNNEMIVPNSDQILLRYLCEFRSE